MVFVDKQAEVRLGGFTLAFHRLAKASVSVFNANASVFVWEVSCSLSSCSLLLKSVTNFFKPWEILTQEWELSLFTDSILNSTPYLPCKKLVVTCNTGKILVFTLIQPFGSDDFSSRGTTAHWICELWEFFSVFRHEILSDFNCGQESCIRTKFTCCDNFSIRSLYLCSRPSSCCAGSSVKGMCVFITLGTNYGVRLSFHNRSPCSIMAGVTFFTQTSDCQVNTELINRNNCAKNSFNRSRVSATMYWQFSTTFALEHSSG